MCQNKLITAAAGSGKTTFLIKEALELTENEVLITTYTQENEEEIRKKVIKLNGCIPENLTIQTWFSFLIQHGVRPYRSILYDKRVKGLKFVNSQSAVKYYSKRGFPVTYSEEGNFDKHYFTENSKVYSDKLSKFVVRCNDESDEKVIGRISEIYSHIFIDEAQDLAGYDLSLLKRLFKSNTAILLVCDPRQVTYLTHWERKYKKYQNGKIVEFIRNECGGCDVEVDNESLSKSYRNNPEICEFANALYPDKDPVQSANKKKTGHDGIFLVSKKGCQKYLKDYEPVQLRWDVRNEDVDDRYKVLNFGQAKGRSFDRVLIYPTSDMLNWVNDHSTSLNDQTRAKFYVAITRARFSVGIVDD